jgi:uncharacterized protein
MARRPACPPPLSRRNLAPSASGEPMRLVISFLAFILPCSAAFAEGPSFDCDKAKKADEIAICDSKLLSELDSLLAFAFEDVQAVIGKEQARELARGAMAARGECGSDADCIMGAQVTLLQHFQELGASVEIPDWATTAGPVYPPDSLPTEIGQCVETVIASITSRFQADINADPDDGSAVSFENGRFQVSYEKEQPIIHSEVGDRVLMCLVSIPEDCPPGDDRGRIYTTTNQRTSESWTLPDSQHSCGGA